MKTPIYPLAVLFMLLLCLCDANAARKEPTLGPQIIDRLINPDTRTEALREVRIATQSEDPVIDWNKLPFAAFELYHQDIRVTRCPQLNDDAPLYLVAYRRDHNAFSERFSPYRNMHKPNNAFEAVPNKHKPESLRVRQHTRRAWPSDPTDPNLSLPPHTKLDNDCTFVFLTAAGKVAWPFDGDTMGDGDILTDINQDGRLERIYTSNYGVYDRTKDTPDTWVQTLHVKTVSEHPTALLHVVLNWHTNKSEVVPRWGWAIEETAGDNAQAVLIGPIASKEAMPEPTVTFHWDATTQQFKGDAGGLHQHYMLLDPSHRDWDELHRVRDAGGMQYEADALARMPHKDSEVDDAPYDWRAREPYLHHSLKGFSNEALVQFMCGWQLKDSAEAKEAPTTNSQFQFKTEWFDLDPRTAAYTLADKNQSTAHRDKYLLYYPTHLSTPEATDWIELSAFSQNLHSLRVTGEDAGKLSTVKFTRSLPQQYPNGQFNWQWSTRALDPERTQWFAETLWWLGQLRSEPRQPEHGNHYGFGMTSSCHEPQTETTLPGVRFLRDDGTSPLDIASERRLYSRSSWRERYGPDVYLGFAATLFDQVCRAHQVTRTSTFESQAFLNEPDTFATAVLTDTISAQWARAMIRGVGDAGLVTWLPAMQALEDAAPEPSAAALELKRLQAELKAQASTADIDAYKKKMELTAQIEALQLKHRAELWSWIREPLAMTIRQLEAVATTTALETWAAQAGEDNANWALQLLLKKDEPAALRALEHVFTDMPEWRSKVLRYFVYQQQSERARAWLKKLPSAEQLPLIPTLANRTQPQDLPPALITDLLTVVQSESVPLNIRQQSARQLTPHHTPSDCPSPEIDHVYQATMEAVLQNTQPPHPERALVYQLGMQLLQRNQIEPNVKHYLDSLAQEAKPFTYQSFLPMVLHLAVVHQNADANAAVTQWIDLCIQSEHGRWDQIAEVIFTSDDRAYTPFLKRLATLDASMAEGDSGPGIQKEPGLKTGSRYHRARQILACWEADDALTRAKCAFLLGLNTERNGLPKGIFSVRNRIDLILADSLDVLTPEERAAFSEFVTWSASTLQAPHLNYRNRDYLKRMVERYGNP